MDINSNNRSKGKEYEDMAAEYLMSQGYTLVARNFFTKFGELDIVALDGDTLCFVEVKYRKSRFLGDPAEAVGKRKQKNLAMAANFYLMKHPQYTDSDMRFDVITILGNDIKLYRNSFESIF